MNRTEILSTARRFITQDRAAEHGDARDNFTAIAGAWQAYLGGRSGISASDVAAMMTILKMCRARNRPQNVENWIDGIGYLALAAEIAVPDDSPDIGETLPPSDTALRLCPAVFILKGEHFGCDSATDPEGRHSGWPHSNGAAEVVWTGMHFKRRLSA